MQAAQTGRTHDLHPTASRKPKESLDPWAPSTHDANGTFAAFAAFQHFGRYWMHSGHWSALSEGNQVIVLEAEKWSKLTQFLTHKKKVHEIILRYQMDGSERKTLKIPWE